MSAGSLGAAAAAAVVGIAAAAGAAGVAGAGSAWAASVLDLLHAPEAIELTTIAKTAGRLRLGFITSMQTECGAKGQGGSSASRHNSSECWDDRDCAHTR
ncbi:MAG: hypothetical protein ACLP1X_20595 [Polyangiaceae bacterium]